MVKTVLSQRLSGHVRTMDTTVRQGNGTSKFHYSISFYKEFYSLFLNLSNLRLRYEEVKITRILSDFIRKNFLRIKSHVKNIPIL